jgi:hypothetical protein
MRNRIWAAALLTAACATAPKTPEKPMTIQEWKGQYGGPEEPGTLVANDRGAWERAWKRVGKDAPDADFAHFVGVLVFVGLKPTGGWSPVFDEPVAQGDDVLVRYRVPKPGGFTTQALARPWKARLFPRPKGRVIVEAAPE